MKRSLTSSNVCKKARILQCYREAYTKEWPFYAPSKISENHVLCKTCGCDFSIAHGGRDDCRRHAISKKHQTYAKVKNETLDKHFIDDSSTTRAELLFASFIIEHNLPIATSDHAKNLFQVMFPDSQIAKKFTCARTKTSALINCLATSTKNQILDVVQQKPFALASDGSTDTNDKKLYPVVISYFDDKRGQVSTVLLSLIECIDNTGKGIFDSLDNEFKKKNIPWKNCISFACDNANTMIGNTKGVTSFMKKLQPSLIVMKCACHLIHLAAKKAAAKINDFDVEQFVVQIFFYLEKSSKRKSAFNASQLTCNLKAHKILKYVSTRWLSLQESINRVLEQWDALLHFLLKQDESKEKNSQLKSIKSLITNPVSKLYCLFLSSTLPVFTSVNEALQQESPQVHKLKRNLNGLLNDILARFINPEAISNADDITSIKIERRKNQKEDCDLVIGAKTRAYIRCEEANLTKNDISIFYKSVRDFYIAAYNYMIKKFPINDDFLSHVEAADVELRKHVRFSSVQYLSSILNFTDEDLDKLESEFALYQNEHFQFEKGTRIDEMWHQISVMENECGILKYGTLCKLMSNILIIPHSNATTERIFSLLRKNMTLFRPNLSTETLSSLLVEKVKNINDGHLCYERKFSKSELESAKTATRQSLTSSDV